jgi:hypothetical protein
MQLQDGKKKKVISMSALLRIGFVKEMSVSSRLEIDSCKVSTPECKTKCSKGVDGVVWIVGEFGSCILGHIGYRPCSYGVCVFRLDERGDSRKGDRNLCISLYCHALIRA